MVKLVDQRKRSNPDYLGPRFLTKKQLLKVVETYRKNKKSYNHAFASECLRFLQTFLRKPHLFNEEHIIEIEDLQTRWCARLNGWMDDMDKSYPTAIYRQIRPYPCPRFGESSHLISEKEYLEHILGEPLTDVSDSEDSDSD
jgi:hypothetical protein